ncbi:MAG TPA: peptidoglycan recognition protein [Mycobacteriales bacterium]|nr:peptidoglycan recognition protein [Mycobacteriales bacterium]
MHSRRDLLRAAVLGGLVGPALSSFAAEPATRSTVLRRAAGAAAHQPDGLVAALPLGTRLVGVVWTTGAVAVDVRWRTAAGWTPWAAVETDLGASAEAGADSGARPGTEPMWPALGADAVGIRLLGSGGGSPELLIVTDHPGTPSDVVGGSERGATASSTGDHRLGPVLSRAQWGADESICKRPTYQRRVDAVVVHHTVNANDYTEAESLAILRSIYAYHVRGRGYDDIAYNLLVDRFGRIFEGRAGGFRSHAIKGSHTGGFNDRTLGVAMIGNLDVAAPAAPMVDAVVRVGAWAADRWGLDPRATTILTSKGSSRYPSGQRVTVPRLLGHRDLSSTACCGRFAYPMLPDLRERVWRMLAPVITDVVVEGAPVRSPEPLRIRARLTAAAAWTISVTSPYGVVVSYNEGRGTTPMLEWDGRVGGLPALPGEYTWTATADDGVHGPSDPVGGSVLVGPPGLSPPG